MDGDSFKDWLKKEGKAATQQRKCHFAANYQAQQVSKTDLMKSVQPHIASPITDDSVPKQDRPMAT